MGWKGKVGHVSTCLTQEEKDIVYEKISLSGLGVCEYMAKCLTEKDIYIIKDLSDFSQELKKIGHQLDYLVYLSELNEQKCTAEILKTSEELEGLWKRIREYLEEIG